MMATSNTVSNLYGQGVMGVALSNSATLSNLNGWVDSTTTSNDSYMRAYAQQAYGSPIQVSDWTLAVPIPVPQPKPRFSFWAINTKRDIYPGSEYNDPIDVLRIKASRWLNNN